MAECNFRKNEFKVKNTNNLTTEQVKDSTFNFVLDDNLSFVGTLTHADEEYLYGNFEHNSDKNIMLVFTPNESTTFLIETEGE